MSESKSKPKREVLAVAWFTFGHKAMHIGFLDADGKIDKEQTYVCFVPDLIDCFSGFLKEVKVYKQVPFGGSG